MNNPKELVAEIKARTDCRDVAEELGLQRRWGNFLCVFHADRNPSLSIKEYGYRCFACDAKGDVVKLVMQVKGIGFRDALEYLAARCGVNLSPRRGGRGPGAANAAPGPVLAPRVRQQIAEPSIDPDRRSTIYTWVALTGRLHEGLALHEQAPAFDYLARRGISAATAVRAGLAFAPGYDATSKAMREMFSRSSLQAAGLFNDGGNLRLFKHQLLIPYWVAGQAVSLQARNINWHDKETDGPKELTIGPITIPFNADVLLEPQETVYICEGAIDTLSLLELGFVAVGVPGARNFRPEWVELFDDVGEVILALDSDDAGREGAQRIAGHFGRPLKQLELPDALKDINEFLTSSTK
jgi:DNA primase